MALLAYTPVVLAGMFMPGTPRLDVVVGGLITTVFITVILRVGLLASAVALASHFVLLGAPLTTDLSSWRGGVTIFVSLFLMAVTLLAANAVLGRSTSRRSLIEATVGP